MKKEKIIEGRIAKIKTEILEMGDMHPGSLSKQYNVCGTPGCRCKDPKVPKKHGPYYQLSFVHRGKSSSRFIKPEFVSEIAQQTANYKKFKALVEDWKALAADLAKLKMGLTKKKK